MTDERFRHPRLAAIYDPLDPDRGDLVPHVRMTEGSANVAQAIAGPADWRRTLRGAHDALRPRRPRLRGRRRP